MHSNFVNFGHKMIKLKSTYGHNYNYSPLSNSMRELTQATKLESSIRLYESLNLSKKLPYKTFSGSTTCQVNLKPLELQYELKIDPAKSYFLNWVEVGYLINFFEWRDYPRNQPFIGPDKRLYKIEPNPLGNKEGNQEDLSKLLREADDLLFSIDTL